ncbi:hypothetical protein WDU94_009902 [Cyamophila willieti]
MERETEEGGVDWGMGEDAEEESDLSENPFAVTNNEELYLDDPKKTLRGWFEREGEELTYDVDDVRQGEYTCRVSLPTEGMLGRNMTAEVTVKGKKKEAVVQCALEACRMLDRYGLLRQANHEARSKRRKKHEDDEYDSDDDTFFDRTGSVEAKRAKKVAAQAGAAGSTGSRNSAPVETYDSLLDKHAQLISLISSLESKLNAMTARVKRNVKRQENEDEVDSLDEFMREGPVCDTMEHKIERRKLKVEIASLRKQEELTRKLVNVAKPASLPELKPLHSSTSSASSVHSEQMSPSEVKPPSSISPASSMPSKQMSASTVSSGQDRDDKAVFHVSEEKHKVEKVVVKSSNMNEYACLKINEELGVNKNDDQLDHNEHEKKNREIDQMEIDMSEEKLGTKEKPKEGKEKRSKPGPSATLDFLQRKSSSSSASKSKATAAAADGGTPTVDSSMDDEDFSNTCWQPPQNQTGDGRTSLNDKYGY